jgi:hypothetical protein
MGSKKSVSIWTASTEWEPSELREIMSPAYSEDRDFLGSEFSKAFSLGFIDDDSIEADKVEPSYSLPDSIQGYSYDTDIISDMKNKSAPTLKFPVDTIVAIYDFYFSGTPKNNTIRNKEFLFFGTFEYKE